jgi:hypothetical protein
VEESVCVCSCCHRLTEGYRQRALSCADRWRQPQTSTPLLRAAYNFSSELPMILPRGMSLFRFCFPWSNRPWEICHGAEYTGTITSSMPCLVSDMYNVSRLAHVSLPDVTRSLHLPSLTTLFHLFIVLLRCGHVLLLDVLPLPLYKSQPRYIILPVCGRTPLFMLFQRASVPVSKALFVLVLDLSLIYFTIVVPRTSRTQRRQQTLPKGKHSFSGTTS